jgi:competence protein ComEC
MRCMSVPSSQAVPPTPPGPRYQPLVIVLTAAVAGILLDRFWPLPLWAWWTAAVCGLTAWLPLAWRDRISLGGFALLLSVAATAGAWHHCRWSLFADDELGRFARHKAQPVCLEVLALGAPRAMPPAASDPLQMMPPGECWRFDADVVALRNGSEWQPVSGRTTLLVQGPPPKIGCGDRWRCFGRLSAPLGPQNPGASDRTAFLRAQRVRSRIQAEVPECLSLVDQGPAWTLWRLLDRLRAHGNRVLEQCLDPRQAELAAAVLLGLREELDPGRNEAFLTTGTIHILSISGLHVGILAGALFWIMRRTPLPRGLAVATIAAITLLYALMVDAEPPVVRSTVLVLVACGSLYMGRRTLGMNSLAAAALVVLAVNPAHIFHVGAQLSFLCVAGLIWFANQRPHGDDDSQRTLQRLAMANLGWLSWMTESVKRSVISLTLAGVALWLLTMPLVMARFHLLSPVALVLNTLLWLPMSLSVLSGFGVLSLGTICPPLGYLCGVLCNLSFRLLEDGINLAQRMPGSHFWMPGPADWWLWGFYGGVGLLAAFPRLRPPRRWFVALAAGWITVGLAVSLWPHDRNRLDCTFLSMGHGCAALLELPSGQTMLYDAGQFGAPSAGVRTISEFLWSRGITHVDAVVLSHPDLDHYNALPGLLEKFSVGAVYVSPLMFEKDNQAVAVLRGAIDRHGVPVREVRAGDRLRAGDRCRVEVLHPPRYGVIGSDNANSLVLAVNCLGREILLPGDLESPGLDDVLAEEPRRCEVLLAPHHGSRKSNSPGLAKWCTPHWVVFSGDGRWSLAETEAPYRAVGSQVLHTFDGGAIQVRIGTEGVYVSSFLQSRCENNR